MSKIFDNCGLIRRLPKDDPECCYVNRMMEMPVNLLRELHSNGESYEEMHGIVPSYKLPPGYSFGNISSISKNVPKNDKIEIKNGIKGNSQNSSNSNSTVKMEIEERENETHQADEDLEMIQTVRGDLLMSDNEKDDEDNKILITDTLKECSKMMPNIGQLSKFQKFYKPPHQIPKTTYEIVRGDLMLSDDDEDNESDVTSPPKSTNDEIVESNAKLHATLDKCSEKLPRLQPPSIYQKLYKPPPQFQKTNNEIKKDIQYNNSPCDKEVPEATNEKFFEDKVKKIVDLLTKKTLYQMKNFQPMYDSIKEKKRKMELSKLCDKDVTAPKLLKLSKSSEKKKETVPDITYRIYSKNNDCELSMNIIPDITKDVDFEKMKNLLKIKSEVISQNVVLENSTKPKYVTQDSLPFNLPDSSTKSDNKISGSNDISGTAEPSLTNSQLTDNTQKQIKKPEAAAKQFYVQSSHSSLKTNPKVAVVTGNVNKAQVKVEQSNRLPTLPPQSSYQKSTQNQSSSRSYLSCKDNNDTDADESKVVQGLIAMNNMKAYLKNDFNARMKNLDIKKWLNEVNSLKEKANSCKKQLDYAPQIMVYIRKNLFYNCSLEVKAEYGKSHHTYLENATMIKQYCSEITQIYNEHERHITDTSSVRLWNIKLVKHFTVVMCHRISAILNFRAFRNVYEECRKTQDMLIRSGVIDRNDRPNQMALSHNSSSSSQHHSSPFSVLSPCSYGQLSTHNSSPRLFHSGNTNNTTASLLPSSNNGLNTTNTTTLTYDMKVKLQRYIDYSLILNTAYSDWMLAEHHHVSFCSRTPRHEECWRDFEMRIIEKTGGVNISSIDDSIPFVIKFLEGYINYMNEFMKQNL